MRSLLLFFALLLPASAWADPLVVRGNRLFVTAEVNGRAVEALLDSGAELSVADVGFARALGLQAGDPVTARGTGGEQAASIVTVARLAAAGVRIENAPIAVIDLGDIAARLIGAPLQFIVGHDVFAAGRLAIDIAGGSIATVGRDQTPPGAELSLHSRHGISAIDVQVEGVPAIADFDLGNGSDVLISRDLAARLELRPVGLEPAGGIGGAKLREVVVIPSLTVAGREFRQVRAHVDPQAGAGDLNLGVRILRHFLITADFSQQKVWLAPRPAPSGPDNSRGADR